MSIPVVLQVSDGTWKWWDGLQIVSFYPKGKRTEKIDIHIATRSNHFDGAVIAACKAEIERRRAMINEQQNTDGSYTVGRIRSRGLQAKREGDHQR